MDILPPNAPESESGVIGCCISYPKECLPEAQKTITSADFFYDLRNQVIWSALNALAVDKVNAITLFESLRDAGMLEQVGGMNYLSECQDIAVGPSFIQSWLDTVLDKATARRLINTCADIQNSVYRNGTPIPALLDAAETAILKIRPSNRTETTVKELVREALLKIELRCETKDAISGISTGLIDLDKQTDGMHGGEIIVVAGFPSTGKTALAVNIAVRSALSKIPAAVFSAEMRPVQLIVRAICSESRTNFYRVTYDDAPRMAVPASKLANAPLFIEQVSGMSIGQVNAVARRLKQKHGIKVIVVDYIQLLSGKGDNREQEISNISKGLKSMALELDCAVLALSQLTDDGKLRESRAIGQDADTIWKLVNEGEWQPIIQPVKLHVEKCRDGATGSVSLTFMKQFTRFECVSKIQDDL